MAEAFTRDELEKIKQAREQFWDEAVEKYIKDQGKEQEYRARRYATLNPQEPVKDETVKVEQQKPTWPVKTQPQPVVETWKVIDWVATDTTPTRPATPVKETVDNQTTNKLVDEWKLPKSQRENVPQKWSDMDIQRWPAFELADQLMQKKVEPDKREKYAVDNNISYERKWEKVVFSPENIDEVISLYEEFWPTWVKISKTSWEAIKATRAYEIYSKYRWADSNTFYQWFKNNEIAVWWENWERLVRMNGGEPTEEMLEAKRKWEENTQISNINNTWAIAGWTEISNFAKKAEWDLAKLDWAFIDFVNNTYWDITQSFNDYKANNDELREANNKISTLSAEIDELNVEKRKVLDKTRERYPHLPLWSILKIAEQEIDAIDDQLFEKQRSYQIAASDYNFLNEQAKAEYEHNVKVAQFKLDMWYKMYWLQRGDIIRQEQIERADKQLADERAYAEEQYEKAIARQDAEAAKKFAYELALIEAKKTQNEDIWSNYKAFGWDLVWKIDPTTWEATFFKAWDLATDWATTWWSDLLSFIAKSEWFSETAYQDPAWVWTIWYGTTKINWEPVKEWDTITKDQAIDLMKEDIARHSNWQTWIQVPLSDAQKTALASFEYNLWPNIWSQWAGNILDMINKWDLQWAANEMAKYNKAENPETWELEPLVWLTNRRSREGQLLMQTWEEWVRTERINWTDVILWSLEWVPVVFERVIKSQIPATLLNSEVELESANEVIKNMYASWVSPEDASAMFQWFKVRNIEDLQFWSNLLKMSRVLNNKPEWFLWDLAASINVWDRRWAIAKIEWLKEIEYQAKDSNAPIRNEIKLSLTRLDNILEYLEENSWPWVLEWKIEKYLWDFKTIDTSELATLMELYNADTRLDLYWTSQTWWETWSFRPLELSTDQKIWAILNKIKRLKEDELNQLNIARWLTLPSLSEDEVLNDYDLIRRYEQKDLFSVPQNTEAVNSQATSSSSILNKYSSSTTSNWYKYNFNK